MNSHGIILSKPVESHLDESVNIVDGIAEELDGRYMLSVLITSVSVDSTLGGGLVTLDTQRTHTGGGGGTLVAAPFVLNSELSRGLLTLDTQRTHTGGGGGTLVAASCVLSSGLSRGLLTLDTQRLDGGGTLAAASIVLSSQYDLSRVHASPHGLQRPRRVFIN